MAWCFEDEASDATDALLDRLRTDEAIVPAVWPLEVTNVLLGAERRGRLSEAKANRFLNLLGQLPIDVEPWTDRATIVAAGRTHSLTSYDASYLVLAERAGVALATLDKSLATAAGNAGVPLLR